MPVGSDRRLGVDGRRRPVDREALRSRIEAVARADETASLRTIARLTGASPETVRAVRAGLRACADSGAASVPEVEVDRTAETAQAFASTESGRQFVDWFARTGIGPEEAQRYGADIPLNRVYEVADEARRRAKQWQSFADLVEGRARDSRLR